jgi:6-phosphofructokinase 1
MAGKTKIIIGQVNNEFVHIPIKEAVYRRKKVDPEGSLWRDVLDATQQPVIMVNKKEDNLFTTEYNIPL